MTTRTIKQYLLVLLKGMAMGAADVVPGVSGGTVAFITGIYEELLDSLRKMTPQAVGIFFKQGPKVFWSHINGTFLLVLGAGVLTSLLSLARVITYLLATYPILVWAFFFGLIIASVIYIARQLPVWRWQEILALAVGTAIALAISVAKPAQLPAEPWMMFTAGAIAICAMILPGVSGSFLLLLMGMYAVFLNALKTLDPIMLASFGAGCALGLLAFSHFLHWLLERFHNVTLALLSGFLVGSLNVIWPWKQTLETVIKRDGREVPVVQENLWPFTYAEVTGLPAYAWQAIVLAIFGVVLVLGLEALGRHFRNAEPNAGQS